MPTPKPKTIEEATQLLPTLLAKSDLAVFKSTPEHELFKFHPGLGRWIRNQWGLWAGSELQIEFRRLGIWHADEMSSILLTVVHRKLHNKPINLETLVERNRS